jgi:hypothetical protein
MADGGRQEQGTWDVGWRGHEKAQLLRMAAMPLALKLRWLEEAQVLVEHLRSQRKPPPGKNASASEAQAGMD